LYSLTNQWVKIEPLDQDRSVRIQLAFPQRYLFAHNDAWHSPHAIFTLHALDSETHSDDSTGHLLGTKPLGREDHPRLK
jgi:hypothetical protein